jgi:hypothetical protein
MQGSQQESYEKGSQTSNKVASKINSMSSLPQIKNAHLSSANDSHNKPSGSQPNHKFSVSLSHALDVIKESTQNEVITTQ